MEVNPVQPSFRPHPAAAQPMQFARSLARSLPLVVGLQAGGVSKVVVRLRPGTQCTVQWRLTHLLCPTSVSVGAIAQVSDGCVSVGLCIASQAGRQSMRCRHLSRSMFIQCSVLQPACPPCAGHRSRSGAAARLGPGPARRAAAAAGHAPPPCGSRGSSGRALPLGAQHGSHPQASLAAGLQVCLLHGLTAAMLPTCPQHAHRAVVNTA